MRLSAASALKYSRAVVRSPERCVHAGHAAPGDQNGHAPLRVER